MQRALELNGKTRLESIGVDSWGVDYALIGERGKLLGNPYHYRDRRTNGAMEAVFERVSRDRIYAITGIQFLPINTLYQLYAACRQTPDLIDAARALVTIPDLLNYWLTGTLTSEYTVATTTQFIDARTRTWATRMLEEVGLPTRLLQPLVENAIVHGLHGIQRMGVISIRSTIESGNLIVMVVDNGTGLSVQNTTSMGLGIGLSSTCERLEKMYPQQHSFSMRSLPEGGTEVRVAIPLRLGTLHAGAIADEQTAAVGR